MKNYNLYLCGITQNEEKNIEQLTAVYNLFDGLIFVDGGSTDKTLEILNLRKKSGKIISRNWTNDFDFQFNEIFRQGNMKDGDWFVLLDSRERINSSFAEYLPELIENLEKNGVTCVYQRSKPFLFKYNDALHFYGNPHWGPKNVNGKLTLLGDNFKDEDSIYSLRNKNSNFIVNSIKYYCFYGRSNHLMLVYSAEKFANYKKYEKQENLRQEFRFEYKNLGYNMSFDSFNDFCKNLNKHTNMFSFFKKELILSNYYRYNILGDDPELIKKEQFIYKIEEDERVFFNK